MQDKDKSKAQLIQELQAQRQRIDRLEWLAEVSRTTSSTMELNIILTKVARLCCQAVDATSVYVASTDLAAGTTTVVAEYISEAASQAEKVSDLGQVYDLQNDFPYLAEWAKKPDSPSVFHADDRKIDARDRAHLIEYGAKSVLLVPFTASGEFAGYISVWESRRKREFAPDEIQILESVAGTVSVVVANAILYDNLRKNERRSRAISELVSDYAYRYELRPDGTWYRDWTTEEAFIRLTGFRREELIGTYDLYHPDERERVAQDVARTFAGHPTENEYRIVTKSGEVRWLLIHRQPEWDATGQRVIGMYGAAQDITKRKELEGYLADSVEKHLTFIEQISEGIWTLSLNEPVSLDLPLEEQLRLVQERGVITECNDAFATMYGFSSTQDVIGKNLKDLYGYDDLEEHWDARYTLAATGYRAGWRETREVNADGQAQYFLNNAVGIIRDGHLHALWGTRQDITARRLAEQVIRASEERYRIVSELSSDYAYKYRVEPDGSWHHEWTTDHAFSRLTGYDSIEIANTLRLYHPEDQPRVERDLQTTLKGQPTHGEYRIITKDGRERWIHLRRRVVWDDSNTQVIGFYGVAEDITERKQAEDALSRERTMLRTLIDTIPDYIYVKDTQGRFLVSNRAHAQILGATPEEMVGKTDFDSFPKALAQKFQADEQAVLEKGESLINHLERSLAIDGTEIWASTTKVPLHDNEGNIVGLVGVTRDITEQFRAEQTLQESERRYRAVIEDQTEMICRYLPDGIITFVNRAYCEFFGKTPDELVGQSLDVVILPEDREPTRARLDVLALDNPVASYEVQMKVPGGGMSWHRWIDRAIFDENNQLVEYQSVGQDITERKRAEDALRISETRLAESQRIAHIGTWVWELATDETFWSGEMYRIANRDPKNFTPDYDTIIEDIHPDDRPRFNATIQEAISAGKPYSLDYRIILPGGEQRHVHTRSDISFDDNGNVLRIAGTTQEITERKRAEQVQAVLFEISRARTETSGLPSLLQFIHEKLNTLINASNFFVTLYDDATELYTFPYWVDEKDSDWQPQKMSGSLTDYVRHTGEPMLITEERHKKLAAEGKVFNRVGTWSLEWLGAPLGVIGVIAVQNYTEKGMYSEADVQLLAHIADNVAWVIENKRAEEAIGRLVHRLQTLQEIVGAILKAESPEAVAEVAIQPLKAMLNCKLVIVALLDFDRQIAIALAHTQNDPMPPLPLDQAPAEWLERMGNGEAIIIENLAARLELTPFEKTIRRNGAKAFTVFPLIFNDNLIGSLTLGMDKPGKLSAEQSGIASEVATQLAVALQQARLHEKVQDYADHLETMVDERTAQLQDKSSEMEAFTYSVSHDLRAPLRAMDGFSRMLMSEYQNDLPERAHHYLNRIQANASRMGVLIDDLLALSRVGRHELQRKIVQTRQIVQSVLDELDANDQIGHSEIQVGDLPPCHADATLLRQVYFNLITNAIKYSSNRDTSKIEIGSELQDDQKLVYYIKDNGVGFDMQYADKLFGVFQRLHNSEGYDGTGIGLATVKRILARHGGDIWATAKENEGAAFYFSFGDLPEENEAYGE